MGLLFYICLWSFEVIFITNSFHYVSPSNSTSAVIEPCCQKSLIILLECWSVFDARVFVDFFAFYQRYVKTDSTERRLLAEKHWCIDAHFE